MSVQSGMLEVPGGKIWYRMAGDDLAGTPLLVLHGGPGATSSYLENLDVLSDERPVVFYDQLGGGRSEKPDDISLWTIERFVDELAAVREALSLERLVILGQSWGALLAAAYLLARGTEGVRGLILSAPLLNVPQWIDDQRKLLRQMPHEIRNAVNDAEVSGNFDSDAYQAAMDVYYRRHLCRLAPWPECLTRTFEEMGAQVYKTMWGPSEFTCTGTLASVNLLPQLKELDVPVLITCGRYDEATPATCQEYCNHIPGAQLAVFEEASHSHHLEQAEHYFAVVRNFLTQISRPARQSHEKV